MYRNEALCDQPGLRAAQSTFWSFLTKWASQLMFVFKTKQEVSAPEQRGRGGASSVVLLPPVPEGMV